MALGRQEAREVLREIAAATVVGIAGALLIPAAALGRVDEMVVTFLSIILAAAIPGVALTAAAARPPVSTPLEARKLGSRLEDQVRFWFGFLLVGGASVGTVLVGSALEWQLATPRPAFIPTWVPYGSAWLVFASVASASFTVIRARHVANAVIGLIRLGTDTHVDQTQDRQRRVQREVDAELRRIPPVEGRGVPASARERRPRNHN